MSSLFQVLSRSFFRSNSHPPTGGTNECSLEWGWQGRIEQLCLLCLLFVSHLRPMGLNVLSYQSHLLQRCHPASLLSPVLALRIFIAMKVQGSYNSSTNG